MRQSWILQAIDYGVRIETFESVEDFLNAHQKFSKTVEIFLDSHFEDEIRREEKASAIYNLGFQNITLATGRAHEGIAVPEFIKAVRGKRPPWIIMASEQPVKL